MAQEVTALKKFLEADAVVGQIQKAIPGGGQSQAVRLVRQALTLVSTDPTGKLSQCTPISILAGCMQAAQLGLELSGPLGHAYLVPRWDSKQKATVATFQTGWKGLVKLAFNSGLIASFPVRTVHANDEFAVEYGTEQGIIHRPALSSPGDPIGYYAIVAYKSGGRDFEFMSRDAVLAFKEKYVKNPGPGWASSFDAMAQKTVVRQLCRRLSMCPEAQAAAMQEEYEEAGVYQGLPDRKGRLTNTRSAEIAGQLDDVLALPAPDAGGEAQVADAGHDPAGD